MNIAVNPRLRIDAKRAKAFAHFAYAVENDEQEVLARMGAKAASNAPNSAGGFLAPDELGELISDLMETYGVIRRYARETGMASTTKTLPRRVGGLTVYSPSENSTITESQAQWDAVTLTARKFAILTRLSAELDEDAIAAGADLADEMARAFAEKEDVCAFVGDGSATYFNTLGVAKLLADTAHAGGVVAASAHDTFAEIDANDLANLVAKLPVRAQANAAWYVSHVAYALVICRLAAAAGGIQVVNGEPHFLGFPVRLTPALPTSTGDLSGQAMLLLGDLRQAVLLGRRRQFILRRSEHRYLELDQIGLQATQRIAIAAHDLGDATNVGAMVALVGE